MAAQQFKTSSQLNQTLSMQDTKTWLDQCDAGALANNNTATKELCIFSSKVCVDDWGLVHYLQDNYSDTS